MNSTPPIGVRGYQSIVSVGRLASQLPGSPFARSRESLIRVEPLQQCCGIACSKGSKIQCGRVSRCPGLLRRH